MEQRQFTWIYILGVAIALSLVGAAMALAVGVLFAGETPGAIQGLGLISSWLSQLLYLGVGVGVVTMAAIEVVKPYVRPLFNRSVFRRWSRSESAVFASDHKLAATLWPGAANNFFELPPERLTAQIQIAFDTLVKGGDRATLEMLLGVHGSGDDRIRGDLDELIAMPATTMTERALEVRQRLGERMQRRLDEFQLLAELEWKRILRSTAIVLSGFLGAFATLAASSDSVRPVDTLTAVLVSAVLGAMFAAVARDFAAALERLRR